LLALELKKACFVYVVGQVLELLFIFCITYLYQFPLNTQKLLLKAADFYIEKASACTESNRVTPTNYELQKTGSSTTLTSTSYQVLKF
jgi:hypothetical protein